MRKLYLAFLLTIGLWMPQASVWALQVQSEAPDFSLLDTSGQPHTLSSHQGQFVVLEWFNYDCPFVKKHYGSGAMQKLQAEWTSKGVVWLSINSSGPGLQGAYPGEKMQQLAQERGVKSTAILLDPEGTVGKLYQAQTTPHLFVIDPEGKLIYQGAIDDRPGTDPSELLGAKNYVAQALEEATQGKPVSEPATKSYGCSVKYAS